MFYEGACFDCISCSAKLWYVDEVIRIKSEQELLECFRPLDREEVAVPKDWSFPVTVKDYLSWTEPSGHRVYLVFNEQISAPALGIVFKAHPSGGGTAASMCEWCHSIRPADGIGLLTAAASSKRRVGLHLCRDLSCKVKAESEPGVNDFQVSDGAEDRIQKIISRMARFARREIF